MSAHRWANDAGTLREIAGIYVNDAGTPRRILEQWVNDAGTLRRVFLGDIIALAVNGASHSTTAPTNATARYSLTAAGDIETTLAGNGTPADRGDWISPQINMSAYECRATLLSGTLTTGTTGSWMNLGATRTWTRQANPGAGQLVVTFTLEIRRASDAEVLVSATTTLTAESAP